MIADPEVEPSRSSTLAWMRDFRVDMSVDVESAELSVASPRVGIGTLDLLVRLPLDGMAAGDTAPKPLTGGKRALVIDFKTRRQSPRARSTTSTRATRGAAVGR